jgi:hypothetical protein
LTIPSVGFVEKIGQLAERAGEWIKLCGRWRVKETVATQEIIHKYVSQFNKQKDDETDDYDTHGSRYGKHGSRRTGQGLQQAVRGQQPQAGDGETPHGQDGGGLSVE